MLCARLIDKLTGELVSSAGMAGMKFRNLVMLHMLMFIHVCTQFFMQILSQQIVCMALILIFNPLYTHF